MKFIQSRLQTKIQLPITGLNLVVLTGGWVDGRVAGSNENNANSASVEVEVEVEAELGKNKAKFKQFF